MANDQHNDVDQFHRKMGVFEAYPKKPCTLSGRMLDFREQFMIEELEEFMDATHAEDITKAFDALLDLVYVVHGAALYMGITPEMWNAGWKAVHEANMRKERAKSADDSKRGHELDVVKPAGWTGPEAELAKILGVEL